MTGRWQNGHLLLAALENNAN